MATALDLIEGALEDLGVLSHGASATSAQSASGLEILNLMIDSWRNERLMVPWIVEENFDLTSGDGEYTVGSSGDFDTTRPIKILPQSFVRISDIDYPLTIVNGAQYNSIANKSVQGSNPEFLFYEPEYPLGVIKFWPLPGSGVTFYMSSWKQIASFAATNTTVSVQPGYEIALRHNLALLAAPGYGITPSPFLIQSARDSKARLKRVNAQDGVLSMPSALIGKPYVRNVYTDG